MIFRLLGEFLEVATCLQRPLACRTCYVPPFLMRYRTVVNYFNSFFIFWIYGCWDIDIPCAVEKGRLVSELTR